MKRTLTLILGIILAMSVVFGAVACGKKQEYNADNFIADTNSEKIVKEKITIKMFVPKHPLHGEWEDMVLFKEMEKCTNIHVEFEEVPTTAYMDKRNLKWGDRKNPTDAFFTNNTATDVIMARDKVYELSDLIDQYAPNYKALMEKYPQIEECTRTEDGKIYTFASVNEVRGEASMQFINTQWIKNLQEDYPDDGYKMPETAEEFEKLLHAFKEKDPNRNGKPDEVPFSYLKYNDTSKNMILNAFGMVSNGIELVRETGQIVYTPTTDNYRQYLIYMSRLYADGLLDPNIFMNTDGDLSMLGRSGALGCFSSAAPFLVVGTDKDSQYEAIGPLTSEINDTKIWYQYGEQFKPGMILIPKTSQYQREIVRWMDLLYSDKFATIQQYGVEGVNWHWTDESKTLFDWPIPEGMELANYMATITPVAGLGVYARSTDFVMKNADPQQQRKNQMMEQYVPYLMTTVPYIEYTLDEMKEIASLEADLNSYMPNAEANFIKGLKNPADDAVWQDHLNKLDAMHQKELVQSYQNAYDRKYK